MRIGIIVEKFPSQSETFILNKVEGLCTRGHKVTVFRNANHIDEKFERVAGIQDFPNLTIVNISIKRGPGHLIKNSLKNSFSLLKNLNKPGALKQTLLTSFRESYFEKNVCDIYHFEFSGLAISYLDIIKKLPGRIVVSCRGSAEKVKPIAQPGRKPLLKNLFENVNAIHCVSNDMSETIKLLGAKQKKIFVNKPAIKSGYFKRSVTYKNNQQIKILSIGRLTFQKGYLIGMLAIKELIKKYPSVIWEIAGDGLIKEELAFYIHDLQLQNHVQLLGGKTTNEIFELYNMADIFFLPSVYEGIANVLLEAMSMELPVVSSDCSGMKEVIEHDSNGMLAPNYDHLQMAEQLFKLCTDFNKREMMGLNARKTIVEFFDIERQLDVFESVYSNLVEA